MTKPPAFMTQFFQMGYVTPDLDQAMEVYSTRFGVSKFLTFDTAQMNPNAPHHLRVGLAWTGPAMIELIQPLDENPLYACAMPKSGFAITLHHLGYLVNGDAQFAEAVAWLDAQRLPIVSSSQMEGTLELVYADARESLGHHLEIVHLFPKGLEFFDAVPKN